jgi:hypothetical protein
MGNQGVMRMCHNIINHRGGIHIKETEGNKHARRNVHRVCSLLAPGSYTDFDRTGRNICKLQYQDKSGHFRAASDAIDRARRQPCSGKYRVTLRRWNSQARSKLEIKSVTRKHSQSHNTYRAFDPLKVAELSEPPAIAQKWITVPKQSPFAIRYYRFGSYHFFKFVYRFAANDGSKLFRPSNPTKERSAHAKIYLRHKIANELYVLSSRDMDDLQFLLHASANIQLYLNRKQMDLRTKKLRYHMKSLHTLVWCRYLQVMSKCGQFYHLRNKLGVYFDVLQWRYMAFLSGNEFVDHSTIMKNKIVGKGLTDMPSQDDLLMAFYKLPPDVVIDMLGIYKASIYPEVDPFQVVCDQRALHMSRHDTDWQKDSPEAVRFEETRSYMWYFGIRVVKQRFGIWPGKIRQGVEKKKWHTGYKQHGVPPDSWRESHDVDLTGSIPVLDISNEQYIRQQDSACAPPDKSSYLSFEHLRKAPRRHKRKLLYAIQEPSPPDLPLTLDLLNKIGRNLPEGYIEPLHEANSLPFSTDIITGSRCERHKDAPRPFYAASPPWGCILSYIDGITRDFLGNVPQSMMGKSTRQKYIDISTAARSTTLGTQAFYMSDDKAKYSPRMDPNSQQLPADFFAELFDIPGIKAVGPIMYHNELYYRVCGHLVHYNSNGTDREGMRGASNTWLEIVAQGLSTRLSRERGYIRGKSVFLSFIDDGLRRFAVDTRRKDPDTIKLHAQCVIDDVIFGLKVLGRELSWDKTFISRELFVILNEIMYEGSHYSSGLKSFVTTGDIEVKEVMSAADYESLYFGKFRGAHGVGAPIDICHYAYVYEVLLSHFKMGVELQDNHKTGRFDYRLFCVTPLALGGGGMRSMLQMSCNEVASATKEGMGSLIRLGLARPELKRCIHSIINQDLEQLDPMDFMREPEQFHVKPPRIRTQRLAAVVRRNLRNLASNDLSARFVEEDEQGAIILRDMGRMLMALDSVSAEEVRLIYSSTPVAFLDEFIQKLASSTTLSEIIGRSEIAKVRKQTRLDLVKSVNYFRVRCRSNEFLSSQGLIFLEQVSFLMS